MDNISFCVSKEGWIILYGEYCQGGIFVGCMIERIGVRFVPTVGTYRCCTSNFAKEAFLLDGFMVEWIVFRFLPRDGYYFTVLDYYDT